MVAFIYIAFLVALFLLNSNRVQRAIEIWNECLIFLKRALLIYRSIYNALFCAYRSISDYISAERYGRKLLLVYSETGDLVKGGVA